MEAVQALQWTPVTYRLALALIVFAPIGFHLGRLSWRITEHTNDPKSES
jgi:hypothetical protein